MKEVFLDTNFLTLPHVFKIDVFAEIEKLVLERYKLLVTTGTIRELESLAEGRGEAAVAAKVALTLVSKNKVEVIGDDRLVDQVLLDRVLENKDTIVCTNDRKLKKKLKDVKAEVICLRGKKRLMRIYR